MPKHEEKSSKTLNEAKNLVIELENELKHTRASWSVFTTGNGRHRKSLHELINLNYEAFTFSHIIRSSASMTVLSLCRLTDREENEKSDCISLYGLKRLINPKDNTSIFVEAALSKSSGNLEHELETTNKITNQIKNLHSRTTKMLKSAPLERMRKLRNQALAHRLHTDHSHPVRPTFDDIGLVFKEAHDIIKDASLLINDKVWDPKDFIEINELNANDFWDRFEDGMKLKYASENPKSPQ